MRTRSNKRAGVSYTAAAGDGENEPASSPTTTSTTTTSPKTSTSPSQEQQDTKTPTAPDTPFQARAETTTTAGAGGEAQPPAAAAATRKVLQFARMSSTGFIAALDQSGGSTPRALELYGISDVRGDSRDMFDLVHDMRSRIFTSNAFTGERVIGAILFEDTVFNRSVEGLPTATFLWEEKNVVPFLKIDKGLQIEREGVQLMKHIPDLAKLLAKCGADTDPASSTSSAATSTDAPPPPRVGGGGPGDCVFGTKARSVIRQANANGIKAVVAQQFAVAAQVLAAGLVPIVEPEVDINADDKAEAERMLQYELIFYLGALPPEQLVCLKLTLPEDPTLYEVFNDHPNVMRVFALSGGYTREEATARLKACKGMTASFSRALTEGLKVDQVGAGMMMKLDESLVGPAAFTSSSSNF